MTTTTMIYFVAIVGAFRIVIFLTRNNSFIAITGFPCSES